jgi:hypothetical protein
MWWETVGCDSPTGSVRSQMQASPSAAATRESKRTRAGSASALKVRASSSAEPSSMISDVSGPQHAAALPFGTASSWVTDFMSTIMPLTY